MGAAARPPRQHHATGKRTSTKTSGEGTASASDTASSEHDQGGSLSKIITTALLLGPYPIPMNNTNSPCIPSRRFMPLQLPPQQLSHLYTVMKIHIVRSGPSALIEPPTIRTEVLALCTSVERARDLARRAWRHSFSWGVPGEAVREFDGLGMERIFGRDESVEVLWLANEKYRSIEEGTEIAAGERRVGVWRAGIDCAEAGLSQVMAGRRPLVSNVDDDEAPVRPLRQSSATIVFPKGRSELCGTTDVTGLEP